MLLEILLWFIFTFPTIILPKISRVGVNFIIEKRNNWKIFFLMTLLDTLWYKLKTSWEQWKGISLFVLSLLFIFMYLWTPLHKHTRSNFVSGIKHWMVGILKLEPSLPSYLSIAGGRVVGCIPFPRVLALCEMQIA